MFNKRNTQASTGGDDKLATLMEGLGKLAQSTEKSTAQPAPETLADDVNLPQETKDKIEQDERLVRDILALFNMNYDDLIRLDETSPYGKAVLANPQLLDAVAKSENPVLAAVKIALSFKPYAEFMDKYGEEPSQIKDAIKAELSAEMATQHKEKLAKQNSPEKASSVTPFSKSRRYAKRVDAKKSVRLQDIFGQ